LNWATAVNNLGSGLNGTVNALGNAIGGAITAIAGKLGIAASHVYMVLVRQMIITGAMETIIGFILTLAGIIILAKTCKFIMHVMQRCEADKDYAEASEIIGCVFGIIAVIVFLGIGLPFLILGIPMVLNPEFAAMQWIVNVVHTINTPQAVTPQ